MSLGRFDIIDIGLAGVIEILSSNSFTHAQVSPPLKKVLD